MKLFQICTFFIITQVSLNYDAIMTVSNEKKYINGLSPTTVGYLYYLNRIYDDYNIYFEFEIEIIKTMINHFHYHLLKILQFIILLILLLKIKQ